MGMKKINQIKYYPGTQRTMLRHTFGTPYDFGLKTSTQSGSNQLSLHFEKF